ncbi:hypothetical protein [Ancylobacter lacus]|uniref:hypothetical protein n=1 Tax=Ancylobacter lacus TaxID=2579970 RepID=UPI001BCFF401|nr:hypothetical protein [Ancylobacter lacus]MBS7540667.1 hypothetical protein [Ancylobacter lacus]
MSAEVFADRFGDMTVTGTTIRIDLVSQSPTVRDDAGQPVMEFRQRVVLPIEGFLRSQEMMQRMLDLLVRQGLVTREAAPAAAATVADVPVPTSPNFA